LRTRGRSVAGSGTEWSISGVAVMNRPGVELYHIDLTIRIHEEDGQWAAECVELGVHSCGDTVGEAFENVREATICYLNTLEAVDQRRQVFEDRGIHPHLGLPRTEAPAEVEVRSGEVVHRAIASATRPDDDLIATG